MTTETPIPTVKATATAGGSQWSIWCVYCDREHLHGAGSGHRVAHCTSPTSPYLRTGYVIELADD